MPTKTTLTHRMKRALRLGSFLSFLVLPSVSMGWGLLGHRVVAEIADSYLSAKSRLAIKQILGNESLAIAANWADFIKSDPAYNYLSPWHYVDYDGRIAYPEFKAWLKADTAVDAYTKMNFLVAELRKPALSADTKKMYLRLLIHIVGDVHQPLHTGHTTDKGGNDVKLTFFGKAGNLHALWDSDLIESQQLSYTEYAMAINFTTAAQRKAWQSEDISKWLFDSHEIAESIYDGAKPDSKLSYRYIFDNISIANNQMLKGGVHLAGLLNEIFK